MTEGRHRSPDPPPRWSQEQIAVACSIAFATVLGGVAAVGTSVAPEAEASPASTPPAVERSTWTPRSLPPLRVRTTTASTTFSDHADTLSSAVSASEPPEPVSVDPWTPPSPAETTTGPGTTTLAATTTTASATTTSATTTQPTQTAPSGSTTTTASGSPTASTTTTSPTASSSEETTTVPRLTTDITDTTEEAE